MWDKDKVKSTKTMSHVSDLQLDDLPGVEPRLLSRLKRAGIQSVLDLAVSIPHELAAGGGDFDDSGVAVQLTQKQYQILY